MKKRYFFFHGWLGLKCCILLGIICLSGALAAISHDIDWLLQPDMRVPPRPQHHEMDWGRFYHTITHAYPDAKLLRLVAPLGPRFAAEAIMHDGQLKKVYFNPYTHHIQGEGPWLNAQRLLRDFHRMLFLPHWGIYVVGFFGFILLGSLITGLLVYKKFWRTLFRLRTNKGIRIFWGDLHRLVGIWSSWFLLVIAITGMWYFIENLAWDMDMAPELPVPPLQQPANGPWQDMDVLIHAAKAAFPALEIKEITLPQQPHMPLLITGQTDALLTRGRANYVAMNPVTGEITATQHASDLPPVQRWSEMADPLHFGNFGGFPVRLLWAVFGLFSVAMIGTGVWLIIKRLSGMKKPSLTMGKWKMASYAILAGSGITGFFWLQKLI